MSEIPTIKRGQTFSAGWLLTAMLDGSPVTSMVGWTGVSQARRRNGDLVSALDFVWIDAAANSCKISASDTAGWPLDVIDIDIMLTAPGGSRVPTPTVSVRVIQGPTHV